VATVVLTLLLIGSLTSFSIGRMRTHGDARDARPKPEVVPVAGIGELSDAGTQNHCL
jgi:hypothetical protein